MSEIQHGKRITIESYFDGKLTKTKHELEINLFSSKAAILKDLIEALEVISSGETKKLTIEILIDAQGRYRIIKRWGTE